MVVVTTNCNRITYEVLPEGAPFALREGSPSVQDRDAGRGHVTHSAFSDSPSSTAAPAPLQRAEPQAAAQPGLGREAADFLIELSVTLQKRAMYPPGHPYLKTSTERLMRRAEVLLGKVPIAVFGIARDQMVVDGAATDPRNNIFSELADRLHRHRLATLRIIRGITDSELDRLVTLLCAEPTRNRARSAVRRGRLPRACAAPADRVRAHHSQGSGKAASMAGTHRLQDADDLWVDLARLAADSSPGSYAPAEAEPVVLARSIDLRIG